MKTWSLGVLCLCAGGLACAEQPLIDDLLAAMEGTFVAANGDFLYRRARVNAPALGKHVVYLQVNRGRDRALYRQRILTLAPDDDGETIVETAWTLSAPGQFEDARADDPAFVDLSFEDLGAAMAVGCEQRWRRQDDSWSGSVDPSTCRIVSKRTGKPRRIQSETRLWPDRLHLVERGFDDSGERQLFGTPPGEFLELRPEAPPESDPRARSR